MVDPKDVITRKFQTGSQYTGKFNYFGMHGNGKFTFPNGTIYEGQLNDGEFHGEGTLVYVNGEKIHGNWDRGKLVSWSYEFPDGLAYTEPWDYCKYPDRRFQATMKDELKPAGHERLTNDPIPRKIPDGCYDAGDGFYNPQNKCIQSIENEYKILRIPNEKEINWIINNCRKAWEEPTGYRPDLYGDWNTGRTVSIMRLFQEELFGITRDLQKYDK